MSTNNIPGHPPVTFKQLLNSEFYNTCNLLTPDRFVSFCKDRGIEISIKELEQYEKLKVFYPLVRIKYPEIKLKIEYTDSTKSSYYDHGMLRDGEKWDGPIKKSLSSFTFNKNFVNSWFYSGNLWDPKTKPFRQWKSFRDKKTHRNKIQSFYSEFQCYTLSNLISITTMKVKAVWRANYTKETIAKVSKDISKWAKKYIRLIKEGGIRGDNVVILCHLLCARYYPQTQTDHRSITVTGHGNAGWDWNEYRRNWNPSSVLKRYQYKKPDIIKAHELISLDSRWVDPLAQWYSLVSYIAVDKRKKLKGKALYAQTLYTMEHLIRLFYSEAYTGKPLLPPDQQRGFETDDILGKGVSQDALKHLTFLTNQFHLNPKPKLILVVEGDGEALHLPRLCHDLLGYSFATVGIQVDNMQGISNFVGNKARDKYGAFEKFIDSHHANQTIVYAILDNEDRVKRIKDRLISKPSRYYPNRTITNSENINIWKKCIELDNFTYTELADAMTKLCKEKYKFSRNKLKSYIENNKLKSFNILNTFYKSAVGLDLNKPDFLGILFDYIIENGNKEFYENGKPKRPIIRLLRKIVGLAYRNYQPSNLDIMKQNQTLGLLGHPIKGGKKA